MAGDELRLDGIVICPPENGHLTYTPSSGGRVCYVRNASGQRVTYTVSY